MGFGIGKKRAGTNILLLSTDPLHRLYDEKPPLECSFPSPDPSLADTVEDNAKLDVEKLRLQHAPPG